MSVLFGSGVNVADVRGLKEAQKAVVSALRQVGAGEQEKLFTEAVLQVHRFVLGNIEVDTGRTKNSVFPDVESGPGGITAGLYTNVAYSPWVRDAGHRKQFFDHADAVEVPRVLAWLEDEGIERIESSWQ